MVHTPLSFLVQSWLVSISPRGPDHTPITQDSPYIALEKPTYTATYRASFYIHREHGELMFTTLESTRIKLIQSTSARLTQVPGVHRSTREYMIHGIRWNYQNCEAKLVYITSFLKKSTKIYDF